MGQHCTILQSGLNSQVSCGGNNYVTIGRNDMKNKTNVAENGVRNSLTTGRWKMLRHCCCIQLSTCIKAAALTFAALLSLFITGGATVAADELPGQLTQPPVAGTESYALEIDVLTQPQPSYRINAQKWGRVFQELGFAVRFREGRPGERTRVENLDRNGTRTALIVGIMEADGRIIMQDRRFEISRTQPIIEFLEQISIWGASGPPSSSPTWGLTTEQFSVVTRLLAPAVSEPVILRTPMEAIDSLKLPEAFRLTFTEAAKERAFLVLDDVDSLEQDLTGFSKGTALAIALAQFGLGFRPLQNPDAGGGYLIEVELGNESSNLWPVGWKTKEAMSTILPNYYKSIEVDVEDVEVGGFIKAVADKLQVAAFQSSWELNAAQLNLNELKYSRKPDKVSPSRILMLLGDKFQLGLDVRTDESGKCFLWVTTRQDFLAFRKRFAHVVPGKP